MNQENKYLEKMDELTFTLWALVIEGALTVFMAFAVFILALKHF